MTLKHYKMGHINEPNGIDFIIQSPPLSEIEKKELSEFIKKRKMNPPKSTISQNKLRVKTKTKA